MEKRGCCIKAMDKKHGGKHGEIQKSIAPKYIMFSSYNCDNKVFSLFETC